jgi:uncharacterized protein with FMN-binding domain
MKKRIILALFITGILLVPYVKLHFEESMVTLTEPVNTTTVLEHAESLDQPKDKVASDKSNADKKESDKRAYTPEETEVKEVIPPEEIVTIQEEKALAIEEVVPIQEEVAPAQEKPVPAKEEITPAKKETTTAEKPTQAVQEEISQKTETLEGSARGFKSTITVEVKKTGDTIESITVLSHRDDRKWYNRAVVVLDNILKSQSTDVDTVSGATYSSRGLINAVRDALGQPLID